MSIKKEKRTNSTKETLDFLESLVGKATLGSTLKAIRVTDEMTQEKFSEILKISTKHLSDIENGRRWVSAEKAQYFAQKLGFLEEDFVELAFQDYLKRKGMAMKVSITSLTKKKRREKSGSKQTRIPSR